MKTLHREQPLVLVVDCDQATLDEISSFLTPSGFLCHCCSSAEAALQAAPLLQPDLIITDASLQGASGRELCARIKQCEGLADVPVIYLSAGQTPDIIRRRDGGQATYHLRKPLAGPLLRQLIEKTFQSTSLAPATCKA